MFFSLLNAIHFISFILQFQELTTSQNLTILFIILFSYSFSTSFFRSASDGSGAIVAPTGPSKSQDSNESRWTRQCQVYQDLHSIPFGGLSALQQRVPFLYSFENVLLFLLVPQLCKGTEANVTEANTPQG